MKMHNGTCIVTPHVYGAVDSKAGWIHPAKTAGFYYLPVSVHLHQRGGSNLVEQQAVGVDQEMMFRARYPGREVGKNQVIPPEQGDKTIGRR